MPESQQHYWSKFVIFGEFWKNHWSRLHESGLFTYVGTGLEYLYPVEYAHQGAAFHSRQFSIDGFTAAELSDDRILAKLRGWTAAFIFDMAIETNLGILAVIEVCHTSPMTGGKRAFLDSHSIPYWEVPSSKTREGGEQIAKDIFRDPRFSLEAIRQRYGK